MKKHTILFLAANPSGTDRLALDQEAGAIQVVLERSECRDRFELVTRWAVKPLDLLHELRKLKPCVVHFSGHGGPRAAGERGPGSEPHRDIDGEPGDFGGEPEHGLFFQDPDGCAQFVSARAIKETFGAAGTSVRLVVLSACYSDVQAEALLAHVDCVVGMRGAILDGAARSFAIGFYGGLGEGESVAAAYKQGCAAIGLEGLSGADHPQLKIRTGVDAAKFIPAAKTAEQLDRLQPRRSRFAIPITIVLGAASLAALAKLGARNLTTNKNKDDPETKAKAKLEIDDVFVEWSRRDQSESIPQTRIDITSPLTSGPESSPKLEVGVLIDVRVRNSGNIPANLTRAKLIAPDSIKPPHWPRWPRWPMPEISVRSHYRPTAIYEVLDVYPESCEDKSSHEASPLSVTKPRLKLASTDDFIPVAHIIAPGEIDNFHILIGSSHPYIKTSVRLELTYNGTEKAISKEFFLLGMQIISVVCTTKQRSPRPTSIFWRECN